MKTYLLCAIVLLWHLTQASYGWTKSEWLTDAFAALRERRYPRIEAVSYWHERFVTENGDISDLRINSTPQSLNTFRKEANTPVFIALPEFLVKDGLTKLIPAKKGIYLSAFPGFGGFEDEVTEKQMNDYETLSGRLLTWAYFSNNWGDAIRFPAETVKLIQKTGRVPFIRMMMRSKDGTEGADPRYTMLRIIDGRFDDELRQWAQDAKAIPTPLLVELGTEVNGDWFPWNGKWNGGSKGADRFRRAYRHIVDLFRKSGVNNITWFYHVHARSSPDVEWNTMASYYPGDDYVDWVGISVYGPATPKHTEYETFTQIMDRVYPEFSAISKVKPLAILEWGVGENLPGKKPHPGKKAKVR